MFSSATEPGTKYSPWVRTSARPGALVRMRVPPNVGDVGSDPNTPSPAIGSSDASSAKKWDSLRWSCRSASTVMPGLPATTTSVHRSPQSASAAPATMEPKLWATTVSVWSGRIVSEATKAVRSAAAPAR